MALANAPERPAPAAASAVATIIVTSVAAFMVALDNLVVTTALPSIREHLHAGLEGLEWTVNAYTLTFAVLLLPAAALGDRLGRRRVFLAGLTLFTLASAAAALSTSADDADPRPCAAGHRRRGRHAAVAHPALGVGARSHRRGAALGVWGAASGLAVALGPVVGGAVTQGASWEFIFWLNVPIGLLLIPAARRVLAEQAGPTTHLDLPGLLLISGGLFGIVFGIVRGNGHGWTSTQVLTALAVGAVLVAAFLVRENRTAAPMLPLRLFRSRAFTAVNIAALLMSFGMFGSVFLLSQFLQTAMGYSPLAAGLRTLPWTAMPVLVAPIAGPLSDRIGGKPLLAAGLALQTAGLAWIAVLTSTSVTYTSLIPAFVLSGIGMGLFFVPVATVVFGSVSVERAGRGQRHQQLLPGARRNHGSCGAGFGVQRRRQLRIEGRVRGRAPPGSAGRDDRARARHARRVADPGPAPDRAQLPEQAQAPSAAGARHRLTRVRPANWSRRVQRAGLLAVCAQDEPVNLRCRRDLAEPAVGLLGGALTAHDGRDLLGDGHVDPVLVSDLDDALGAFGALGDHAELAGDLLDRAAAGDLLADPPVARKRRKAGGHQVAEPGQPGERARIAAHRDAEPGHLGQAAGDDHGPGVVADAEPLGHSGGDRDDVLQRAAELAADHVDCWCRRERPCWRRRVAATRPGAGQASRSPPPRRSPASTSRARFGPESTPHGWPGSTSSITCVIRMWRAALQAFRQAHQRDPRTQDGRRSRRGSSRNDCEGTPTTTTSAS